MPEGERSTASDTICKDKAGRVKAYGPWEDTILTRTTWKWSLPTSNEWGIASLLVRSPLSGPSRRETEEAVIAHSRGSIFSSYFLSTRPHAPIPLFISISARYKMDNLDAQRIAVYSRDFAEKGYSEWKVRVAGQSLVRQVTQDGVSLLLTCCQVENRLIRGIGE